MMWEQDRQECQHKMGKHASSLCKGEMSKMSQKEAHAWLKWHLWARIRKGNTVCLEIIDFFCFSGYGVLTPFILHSRAFTVVIQRIKDPIHPLFLFNKVPQNENFRFPINNSWLLGSESCLVRVPRKSSLWAFPELPWTQWCSVLHPIPSVPQQIPSASNKHAMECSVNHKKHGVECIQPQKARQKGLKPQKYINLFFAMHL